MIRLQQACEGHSIHVERTLSILSASSANRRKSTPPSTLGSRLLGWTTSSDWKWQARSASCADPPDALQANLLEHGHLDRLRLQFSQEILNSGHIVQPYTLRNYGERPDSTLGPPPGGPIAPITTSRELA